MREGGREGWMEGGREGRERRIGETMKSINFTAEESVTIIPTRTWHDATHSTCIHTYAHTYIRTYNNTYLHTYVLKNTPLVPLLVHRTL